VSDEVTIRPALPRPTGAGRPRPASRSAAAAAALLLAAPAAAAAQDVGHRPEESPCREVPFRQEATVFGGWYAAASDPVGVAPRSGPIAGLRYEIRVGGPAQFYARAGVVRSERTIIDPINPVATRTVGETTLNLLLADVGLSMNLTGQKSWNGIVPVVSGGLGIASDLEDADVGGFRLGTPFAVSLGAGLRWVPGGNLQLRADVTDHLYQVKYPDTYFAAPSGGGAPVRGPTDKQNLWQHNVALTVGASYLFFR
jgi:hypothetical protein